MTGIRGLIIHRDDFW